MTVKFCDHLDAYGAQYTRTDAAYRQCVHLMEKILVAPSGTDLNGLNELVVKALAEWSAEDQKLRDMLVEEVRSGRVRVPNALLKAQGRRAGSGKRKRHHPGHLVCAACRRELPRLSYPEWEIAHNGVVAFKGEELPTPAAV